jgi:hypothetical protein
MPHSVPLAKYGDDRHFVACQNAAKALRRPAMDQIYVEAGKMDVSKAPKNLADTAEAALKDAVKDAIKGDRALTDKKGEGYVVTMKIEEMTVESGSVSCRLSGDIARAPKREMVTTSMKNGASAQGGKPGDLVKKCIGGAAAAMMEKAIPIMKKQGR